MYALFIKTTSVRSSSLPRSLYEIVQKENQNDTFLKKKERKNSYKKERTTSY